MKRLKTLLKEISDNDARRKAFLRTGQSIVSVVSDGVELRKQLVEAVQSHVLDLEELVGCLRANAVEVLIPEPTVFGESTEHVTRLQVLPRDVENLEGLR